ncbi:MAG: helix-turn-helix domain-containing protein [Mycobacteriales bacterium]
MPNDRMPAGPVAQRVAVNVRQLRKRRGLDLADVSDRMRQLGRPMAVGALSKLELGQRRVDVDDLAALAIALNTTPNRLLLSEQATDATVGLTPTVTWTGRQAWRWASGEGVAPLPPWERIPNFDRSAEWTAESRPHDPPDTTSWREIEEHKSELADFVNALWRTERETGLPRKAILGFIDSADFLRSIWSPDQAENG